jgi:hypothetical protein
MKTLAILAATIASAPTFTLATARHEATVYERHHNSTAQVQYCRWSDHRHKAAVCMVTNHGISWAVAVTPRGVTDGSVPLIHPQPVTFTP